jgi:1,4-dihydroxy-2-naphthoyl-CoA hydrolase
MKIWTKENIAIEELNEMGTHTLAKVLDMQFVDIGDDYLKLRMPVDHRTHQPYGLLHGGASAALAETVGSVASWLCIDRERQICVGMEINCNHIRGKRNGFVTATASPLHLGATSHVWDIRIHDENDKLVCVSRLTMAVLKKKD